MTGREEPTSEELEQHLAKRVVSVEGPEGLEKRYNRLGVPKPKTGGASSTKAKTNNQKVTGGDDELFDQPKQSKGKGQNSGVGNFSGNGNGNGKQSGNGNGGGNQGATAGKNGGKGSTKGSNKGTGSGATTGTGATAGTGAGTAGNTTTGGQTGDTSA